MHYSVGIYTFPEGGGDFLELRLSVEVIFYNGVEVNIFSVELKLFKWLKMFFKTIAIVTRSQIRVFFRGGGGVFPSTLGVSQMD